MTSNVGSDIIAKETSLGFIGGDEKEKQRESLREKVLSALKDSFRPEFLNRIDDIVIFNFLSKSEIKKIVNLELDKVVKRLKKKDIDIRIEEPVKDFIAEKGFDSNLGARPLKRVIQKKILDPLSLKIISGEFEKNKRIIIDFQNNKIIFLRAKDLIKSQRKRQRVSV